MIQCSLLVDLKPATLSPPGAFAPPCLEKLRAAPSTLVPWMQHSSNMLVVLSFLVLPGGDSGGPGGPGTSQPKSTTIASKQTDTNARSINTHSRHWKKHFCEGGPRWWRHLGSGPLINMLHLD